MPVPEKLAPVTVMTRFSGPDAGVMPVITGASVTV